MHSSCLKFFGCCSGPKQESAPVKNWRASYATSLRGNLVRTYKTPIDDDYYIDNDHELGKGGCGVVVVGEHKETHAQYAIKIVNKSTAERGRLDRELKLLKDVDHANIVRLFSLYDLPTHMYFVMELCLGGHLGNLLSRQASKCVDEDWGRKLARQLVSAVAHIHSRGIAHRDIKLQNILIDNCTDRTAQLKLIDFGYGSRYIGALPMKTKCGTPYTTAPEVIRECYDERCDVWSMGVVIYIMLCGRRPFEALDIPGPLADAGKASMITNILAGRYHFNHKAWLNVSKAGIAFVKTLLHPDYKTRIHSHEALEVPWLSDGTVMSAQASMLKSAKSFHAVSNMKKNTEASEMQRTGMVALVFGINSKAATDLRNVFQSFDYDGSGMLSRVEFEKALHEISPELSSADINHLFDIVDLDKNKQISYSEFLAATLDPNEVDIDELSKAFKLLDEDGNGYITKDELRKVLTFQYEQAFANHHTLTSGAVRRNSRDLRNIQSEALHRVVEEKIVHIFEQVDVNNDGVISHSEFLCAMTGLDFYLDGSEGLFGEEEDEQDYEGDNEQPSNPHEKFTPPPTHKQFSESLYGGVGSNKFQNMDLADVTNNEYAYVPERDGDDVLEDVESVSVKSPGGPFASDKPVLGQPDAPATSGAAMHSRIRDLVNSGSNGVYSSPVQSQRNTLISKQQSTNRMQLEPIADNSHSTGDKMSRQSSVRSNHPVLKQGSSKINIHGVPAINLPPSSGSDNSGGGAPVAYTGILSHHKRDDSTYMRPLSGNANKADTFVVEASPRRGIPTDMPGGNLAFYGVQESIDVVKEDDTSSSSYGATKIATLFGSPPLKPQISKRSFDTEGGEKDRSISPKTGRSSKTSSFAPPKLNPSGSFKNNAPLSSPYRSRPSATDLQFTDINKSRDDEDRPTDLRASFALKGRAPSYRNTTIMDSSSENIKVLVEDAQGGAAASTAEENGAAAAERNALSRKVSRPGMPTFAAHNSDTDVALVEPAAPPPMLRAGSKAFSFKKLQDASGTSRPGTSRQGGDDDFYGSSDQRGNDFQSDTNGLKGMASPMLGSIKKMLSVGKLNQNK